MDVRATLILQLRDQMSAQLRGVGQATEESTTKVSALGQASQVAGAAMAGLALAGVAVAGGMKIAKEAYDVTIGSAVSLEQETRKLQFETGATAEQAGQLAYAANVTGLGVDKLSTAINIATRALASHKSLGIEPNIDGLAKLSDMYLQIQDPIQRNAFLLHEFGRSGADMAPLMVLGAAGIKALGDQATLTGNVLSQSAVTQLHTYDLAVNQLTLDSKGLGVALGVELAPAAMRVVDGGLNLVHTLDMINAAQKDGIITAFGADAAYVTAATSVQGLKNVYNDLAPKVEQVNYDMAHGSDASDRAAAAAAAAADSETRLSQTYTDTASKIAEYTGNVNLQVTSQWKAQQASDAYNKALADQAGKMELSAGMAGKLTTQMIFQTASVGLNTDDQLALARSLGLVDEQTLKSIRSIQGLQDANTKGLITTQQFISGVDAVANSTAAAAWSVNNLAEQIAALHDKTITITTIYGSGGPGYEPPTGGGGSGGGGGNAPIIPPSGGGGGGGYINPAAGGSSTAAVNALTAMVAAQHAQNSAMPSMIARAVRDALQQGH